MSTYRKLNDLNLIDLLREGDRVAYTQIYDRYERLLFIHAYSRLQKKEESRDIVQDIFIVLWNNREKLEVTRSLRAYLFTAVRNRIFNLIAKEKLESEYLSSLENYITNCNDDTDYNIRYTQLMGIIDREIALLPRKMREVFELSRYEELSHREIADILAISEQTVKKQVQNALKILKNKLGSIFPLIFL
ncbi:RNA polymerase sigma-70 factor [Pedobacter psychrodurus]|uniref:RNA polymerase sigma-70 factor n=1 Tax=Pedobacter psychrodurus TaxID=2530456 RepID=A0A4R0Q2W1_9SPHI|nr:RNA polymerase sigma-70 factor [Pedobacter psychrodurus]TCD28693.1 RNA polymerase sigma-70 factor [Pedobacter psychrodurus]